MGESNWMLFATLSVVFIAQISCEDANTILSYVDLEGEKGYKFVYSDLLHRTPQEEKVEIANGQNSQVDTNDKRQILSLGGGNFLWPKNVVPYKIDSASYTDPSNVKTVVTEALRIWSKVTCVEFWDIDDPKYANWASELGHRHYAIIMNERTCNSYIGYQNPTPTSQNPPASSQTLKLNEPGCIFMGTVLHETGHLLGLVHEQARTDRDQFVKVNMDNIAEYYKHNYNTLETLDITNFDYNSIMHYGIKDFNSNQKDTMTLKDPNLNFLTGQRDYLTFYDIKAINLAYTCNAHCAATLACENDGYLGPDCVCVCPSLLSGDACLDLVPEYSSPECNSATYTLDSDDSVEITSPNYPFSYGNTNCAWLVKGPVGKTMTIAVSLEDIPRNKLTHKCYHSIEIRSNILGQQGLSFCGHTTFPYRYESMGDSVMVILHADMDEYAGRNFKVKIGTGKLRSACVSNPCPGYGQKCVDGSGPGEYTCDCMDNFVGDDCSTIESISCSFDILQGPLPVCMFTQNPDEDLDWLRISTRTPTSRTGPDSDVGGTGSYIYMESSRPATTGSTATLDSAVISRGQKCLSFFYNMYGDTMGELYLTLKSDVSPGWTYEWMKAGDQGEGWKHVLFTLTTGTDFTIHFKAVRGSSHRSDIALDSVSVTIGACPEISHVPILNLNLSPQMDNCPLFYTGPNCDMINEVFCNFDSGSFSDLCVFSNDKNDDFDWEKLRIATPSSATGPSSDVSGSGFYVYTEASGKQPGAIASLVSDFIQGGEVCVHFKIHMHGSTMGKMVIKFVDESNQEYSNERSGNLGNGWVDVFFNVESKTKFKLIIESIRGPGFRSDIAIDDVNISRGRCITTANYVNLD